MTISISDPAGLKAAIRTRALDLGFAGTGVTAPAGIAGAGERLDAFLAAGRQGDMDWMAERAAWRRDPAALWPAARSIVMLATNYGPDHDPLALLNDPGRGAVSAYAARRDYHDVVKKRLKTLGRWLVDETGCEIKVFVDTAPVMEKPLAAAAGLGWQGKHTNLVSRSAGSWTFLGAIFTTLDLPADEAGGDHCGACRRCLDVCPTDAFPSPYQLDANRCIAYLTVEHRGPIPHEFRTAIGNRIFGCDDCLAVCPWNKFARASRDDRLAMREEILNAPLAELLELDDAAFRRMFAQTPVKRLGRDRFLRNVLMAVGNAGDESLSARVEGLLDDASPLVRGAAVWALSRIVDPDRLAAARARCEPGERDADVLAEWSRL
ncbi:MAG: tRNA epoxyqueuosine(34) reductase QueG [Rhizobiales bacterium NRL2]|jgi:epoxyqueuosine reductase|nr:MAG: tRNA epoxyqueuosine(34) reductase QueG [Rhizobiales bacterium NRL2]